MNTTIREYDQSKLTPEKLMAFRAAMRTALGFPVAATVNAAIAAGRCTRDEMEYRRTLHRIMGHGATFVE